MRRVANCYQLSIITRPGHSSARIWAGLPPAYHQLTKTTGKRRLNLPEAFFFSFGQFGKTSIKSRLTPINNKNAPAAGRESRGTTWATRIMVLDGASRGKGACIKFKIFFFSRKALGRRLLACLAINFYFLEWTNERMGNFLRAAFVGQLLSNPVNVAEP